MVGDTGLQGPLTSHIYVIGLDLLGRLDSLGHEHEAVLLSQRLPPELDVWLRSLSHRGAPPDTICVCP